MFGRIGMEELLVILALAVLVFGPRRLPEFGKAIGQTIKEFRNVGRELHGDDEAPRV